MWVYSDQWAAGFFDGEGCITIERRADRKPGSVVAQTVQKMRAPLDAMQDRWGGKVDSMHGAGVHRWRLSALRARDFLAAIYPHSIVKRRQIEIAFAYMATMGSPGQRTTPEVLALREQLMIEIKNEKREWN